MVDHCLSFLYALVPLQAFVLGMSKSFHLANDGEGFL
jgi:hypothetical protein